ncbi:MAG: hypothetical protein KatS3mg053_1353 [Candidatus Roseilinea sp.]|nr:MAG: hypothetical protein KatS3mg053_1353 [Candidatus Roseilinea sp.]
MTTMEETTKHTALATPIAAAPAGDSKVHPEHIAEVTASHEHAEAHEPHMPAPSLSPIILGAGMTLAAFGIVLHPIMLIIGVVGILVGLGTWLYDEIVNAGSATSDHE